MSANEVTVLEKEIKEYKFQLDTVRSGLATDPDNEELLNLKVELEEVVSLTQTAIDELKPASATPQEKKPSATVINEKWSREKHPAFQAGYQKPAPPESPAEEVQTSTTFSVNDTVLAKWVSGDHGFYPARITSITGSKNSPVYIVSFKSYDTIETLSGKDIKAIDSKKRKADGSPATASPAASTNTSIISAAAAIDPDLASQARKEPSKVSDGPARPAKVPRKVKANKELEAGKNKWQDFTVKGGKMSKTAKKESMFRTPDGVNGRVGFTGSGQSMRKDPTRSRHIYQPIGDEE